MKHEEAEKMNKVNELFTELQLEKERIANSKHGRDEIEQAKLRLGVDSSLLLSPGTLCTMNDVASVEREPNE